MRTVYEKTDFLSLKIKKDYFSFYNGKPTNISNKQIFF
ncbi:hypothetical protein AC3_A0671 [Clostridium perfringens E str. JGS1987]|uniref:Uncharacterized protein n=1 Tax=Clostridium perfringens E str. JGS1987 TaxID=451755 RepID=B1BVT6_CLOPF|nr:hypothetical protein AC3_A0671 [Clostridium perfringens E str. JGS1987]